MLFKNQIFFVFLVLFSADATSNVPNSNVRERVYFNFVIFIDDDVISSKKCLGNYYSENTIIAPRSCILDDDAQMIGAGGIFVHTSVGAEFYQFQLSSYTSNYTKTSTFKYGKSDFDVIIVNLFNNDPKQFEKFQAQIDKLNASSWYEAGNFYVNLSNVLQTTFFGTIGVIFIYKNWDLKKKQSDLFVNQAAADPNEH